MPPARESRWQRLLQRVWTPPDPDLVDAGLRGEWMVAGIRILLILILIAVPLNSYLDPSASEARAALLWVGVAALAEALIIYSAVMRSWGRRWIGFFSGVVDVSLVSLGLWISMQIEGDGHQVTESVVVFSLYFLAIGATSLRYDWRICLITGLAAIVQYGALFQYAVWQYDLNNPEHRLRFDAAVQVVEQHNPGLAADLSFGEVRPYYQAEQFGRLLLLLMATVLSITLVVRALEQRSLSNRDRLTNLANRGFFDESLMRMGALAARTGESVAVAMIDVDHFKKFNDTYGHQAGDEALRTVSRIIAGAFRTTDLLARYGGEEFAGLFPGLKTVDAHRRLDALRAAIEAEPIVVDTKGGKVHVTVSIGAAVWPLEGVHLKETLSIADLRLYQAKNGGRNRVVASADGSLPEDRRASKPPATDSASTERKPRATPPDAAG